MFARRHARNRRFTFGTGKFCDLTSFASGGARPHRPAHRLGEPAAPPQSYSDQLSPSDHAVDLDLLFVGDIDASVRFSERLLAGLAPPAPRPSSYPRHPQPVRSVAAWS